MIDAQLLREACASPRCHLDRPVGLSSLDPAELEEPVRERGAERPGDVEVPLAPVQAAADDRPPRPLDGRQVDAELLEPRAPLRAGLVAAVVPNERAVSLEGPGERDADPAREMVVTGARLAKQLATGCFA